MEKKRTSTLYCLYGILIFFAQFFLPTSSLCIRNSLSFRIDSVRSHRPRNYYCRNVKTISPNFRYPTLFSVKSQAGELEYDPFETANKIEPETMSLPESMVFYARFVVERFYKNRMDKKMQEKMKGRKRAMWKMLDEQRKNVMTLAGYTPSLVVPSFIFLFLGALMTSIVPSYYSKCIQCVSTLATSRTQLVGAMMGLGITSTLAALFTGLRGSLFWIGGKWRKDGTKEFQGSNYLLIQSLSFYIGFFLWNRKPCKL